MFELWAVMGRTMVDKEFLGELLDGSHNATTELDDLELYDLLLKKGYRTSRFERGEIKYWLEDELFVEMLRELAAAFATTVDPSASNRPEFHAAVALTLFDKQFQRSIRNAKQFGFNLSGPEIEGVESFLANPKVQRSFRVLERLGWDSSCAEGLTHDPGYIHKHDGVAPDSDTPIALRMYAR